LEQEIENEDLIVDVDVDVEFSMSMSMLNLNLIARFILRSKATGTEYCNE
jgi:hypothetical protein